MPRPDNEKATGSERAYDFSDFHNGPDCIVSIVPNDTTGGLWLFCEKHHVAADAEAVSTRLRYQAALH